MKNTKHLVQSLFLLLLIVLMGTPTFAQKTLSGGWKLQKQKGDLKVYTRPNTNSGIKEIRIITDMDCSIESLMMVLNDVPSFKQWVYKTSNARLLKRVSGSEAYYYSESDMPFPTSNRDLVVHSKQWEDNNGVIHARSRASTGIAVPKKRGVVRVTEFESRWRVTPTSSNRVHIDYQAKTDPGGSIPNWLINMAITVGPVNTIENLSKMVRKAKYQNPPKISYKDYSK